VDRSGSAVPAHAVPGVGAGPTTHERGLSIKPRTAAVCRGAAGSQRLRGGGRPCAVLHVGNAERQRGGPESLESSFSARPHLRAEDTAERRPPWTSRRSQGKRKVHALIAKVYSRKNLERAWEKVKKNRGRAGIDDVTIADCETRKGYYLDLWHRKLRAGTYRPQPVKRVAIPKPDGGVRQLGIPTVLDRVCQQALVQRMEPILSRS
jgi:hypothetical protein